MLKIKVSIHVEYLDDPSCNTESIVITHSEDESIAPVMLCVENALLGQGYAHSSIKDYMRCV